MEVQPLTGYYPTQLSQAQTHDKSKVKIGEEKEQKLMEQQENYSLPTIMPELWQEIFSHLNFEDILSAKAVNRDWNQLITGFRQVGVVGVENKPSYIIDTSGWTTEKKIDFYTKKLGGLTLTPATISSFAFYHLMGHIDYLPRSFWSHLQGTQVHTLGLDGTLMGAAGASELAKALPATRVHTLHLDNNRIGAAGAIELAKALPSTQVHTLNLGNNQIGYEGVIKLAKALPSTKVHTLNLGSNKIGDEGASEIAKALPATQVHTLSLWNNQIGDAGAIELAKALPATRIHTLYLNFNQIGAATQQLLKTQYPHIKWAF
jgi:hypothetical protein